MTLSHSTVRTHIFIGCLGVASFLLGGQFSAADSLRHPVPSATQTQKPRTVSAKVKNLVAIAVGDEASSTVQIGTLPPQAPNETTVTIEADTLVRAAIGPKASVCIQLPLGTVPSTCD